MYHCVLVTRDTRYPFVYTFHSPTSKAGMQGRRPEWPGPRPPHHVLNSHQADPIHRNGQDENVLHQARHTHTRIQKMPFSGRCGERRAALRPYGSQHPPLRHQAPAVRRRLNPAVIELRISHWIRLLTRSAKIHHSLRTPPKALINFLSLTRPDSLRPRGYGAAHGRRAARCPTTRRQHRTFKLICKGLVSIIQQPHA